MTVTVIRGRSEPVAHPEKPLGNGFPGGSGLMPGHLGCDKTRNRLMAHFKTIPRRYGPEGKTPCSGAEFSQENLLQAQERQQRLYNRGTWLRHSAQNY